MKRILLAVAVLVAIVSVCWYAVLAYHARAVDDAFFVRGAALEDPDLLGKLEVARDRDDPLRTRFGFFVHRIVKGVGTVIGHRHFSGGNPMAVDDEEYRKVTIWLPSSRPGPSATIDLAQDRRVRVLLSQGASAWPRNDCSGRVSAGTLNIRVADDSAVVTIDGVLAPLGNSRLFDLCKPQAVHLNFEAKAWALGGLTPWLGARATGHDPSGETFR